MESSLIEIGFKIFNATPDESFMSILVYVFESVLRLAKKEDFDKACEELQLVYSCLKNNKSLNIPGAYIKKIWGLLFDLSKYEKIREMPEYDDLRDIFGFPSNHINNNIDK